MDITESKEGRGFFVKNASMLCCVFISPSVCSRPLLLKSHTNSRYSQYCHLVRDTASNGCTRNATTAIKNYSKRSQRNQRRKTLLLVKLKGDIYNLKPLYFKLICITVTSSVSDSFVRLKERIYNL